MGAAIAYFPLFETLTSSQTHPTGSLRRYAGSASVIAARSLRLGGRFACAPPASADEATATTAATERRRRLNLCRMLRNESAAASPDGSTATLRPPERIETAAVLLRWPRAQVGADRRCRELPLQRLVLARDP